MKWITDNWAFFIVVVLIIFFAVIYVNHFIHLPTSSQMAKLRSWALYIVIEMEKTYGHGTGSLKLVAAYNSFVNTFPSLVSIVSFELFSEIIDEALVQMKKLISTNLDIAAYVEQGDK